MNKIIIISGNSGAGKTTIAKKIVEQIPNIKKILTCTTRQKRQSEVQGIDYNFVSEEQFKEWIKNDELNEYEKYAGSYYGSLRKDVLELIHSNSIPLFVVESKGALNLSKKFFGSITIFIKAPTMTDLEERLRKRGDNEEVIKERLKQIPKEQLRENEFDYVIVNDKLEEAVEKVKKIIMAETN
jgi:guanylate kinase